MVDTVPDTSNKSTPENVMFSIFSNAQSWNNGQNLVTDTSFWKWVAFYFFKGATAYEDHWIQTYVQLLQPKDGLKVKQSFETKEIAPFKLVPV